MISLVAAGLAVAIPATEIEINLQTTVLITTTGITVATSTETAQIEVQPIVDTKLGFAVRSLLGHYLSFCPMITCITDLAIIKYDVLAHPIVLSVLSLGFPYGTIGQSEIICCIIVRV